MKVRDTHWEILFCLEIQKGKILCEKQEINCENELG